MTTQSYNQSLNEAKKELFDVELQIKELNERKKQLLKNISRLKKNLSTQFSHLSVEYFENCDNFDWSQDLLEKSQSIFKITKFRYLQKAAINATLSNLDCILVMPTGYCFS